MLARTFLHRNLSGVLSNSRHSVRPCSCAVLFQPPPPLARPAQREFVALLRRVEDACEKHDVHKLEHVTNDTYVLACGVPEESTRHPVQMVQCALELRSSLRELEGVQIKIGIHTGQEG